MAKIKNLNDMRRMAKYKDQHGREYSALIETMTGEPASALFPAFRAPVVAPQKYLKTDPDVPGKVEIDYVSWRNDMQDAAQHRRFRMEDMATSMYGDKAGEVLAEPTPMLLRIAGPEPYPVELIDAAATEDAWALTGEGELPEYAKPFVSHLPEAFRTTPLAVKKLAKTSKAES